MKKIEFNIIRVKDKKIVATRIKNFNEKATRSQIEQDGMEWYNTYNLNKQEYVISYDKNNKK